MKDIEELDFEECDNKCIVSLCYGNKTLGIACFNELRNSLSVDAMPLSQDDTEDVIFRMKLICTPTLFLLHPKIILNKELLELILQDLDSTPNKYRYTTLKSSCWSSNSLLDMVSNKLKIKDAYCNKIQSTEKNFLSLMSIIDLDSEQLRQALGGLLTFMQATFFNMDDGNITVSTISQLHWESFLRVDEESQRALQIFSEEIHPNVIKGSGRSKEGFSLFGLLDRTRSLPGRQRLRDWLKKPLFDKLKILERQKGVEFVIRPENTEVVSFANKYLRKIHDISKIILRIKKVEATHMEWYKLHTTLSAGLPIIDCLKEFLINPDNHENDRGFVGQLLSEFETNTCAVLLRKLSQCIDFDESLRLASLYINDGYDLQLDELRSTYDNLEAYLTAAAHQVLDIVPLIQNVAVEYVPQVGYLVVISKAESHLLLTVEHGFDDSENKNSFQFVFQQDDCCYFKHAIVRELDDSIGDIKNIVADRQKLLLIEAEEFILENEPSLHMLCSILSTLDATISLGIIANEMKFQKPEISDEPVVIIKNGRHPLQELTVETFVPNDTFVNRSKNVALITGPNSSGKSVYLKQVGLIVYLAHIGSWVPCERAIIGLTDRIFTRIASTESVTSAHSSFSLDLSQISKMLNMRTEKSLCLIDEFGKGTAPVDGIALLATTIRYFIRNRAKVLFVLHFTEIFREEILGKEFMDAVMAFHMITHITKNPKDEHLIFSQSECDVDAPVESETNSTPLYKLAVGVTPESDGISCAKEAGLKTTVVERSVAIKKMITSKKPIRCATLSTSIISDTQVI